MPAGRGGTIQMTFAPERTYLLGLDCRGVSRPSPPADRVRHHWQAARSRPGAFASVEQAAAILALNGTRRWRGVSHRWTTCPRGPRVGLRRQSAPDLVAVGGRCRHGGRGSRGGPQPGEWGASHIGAFSAPAQACAVIALTAVLVADSQLAIKGRRLSPSPTTVLKWASILPMILSMLRMPGDPCEHVTVGPMSQGPRLLPAARSRSRSCSIRPRRCRQRPETPVRGSQADDGKGAPELFESWKGPPAEEPFRTGLNVGSVPGPRSRGGRRHSPDILRHRR